MQLPQQILNEFEKNNHKGLLILSKGIGLLGILHEFIRRYASYNSLTLIINLNKDDSLFYRQNFTKGLQMDFALHNHEYETPQKREKSYLKGGVIFTTSQIVTLDLLTRKILPADIINNMLVFNGESYYYNSTNFLLRLCKEQSINFSKPERLLLVSERLDRIIEHHNEILTETFTVNSMIWPYFRLEVKKDLEAQEKSVVISECEIEFDQCEKQLQRLVLEILAYMEKKFASKYSINIKDSKRKDLAYLEDFVKKLLDDYYDIQAVLYQLCERPLSDVLIYVLEVLQQLDDDFFQFMTNVAEFDEIIETLEQSTFKLSPLGNDQAISNSILTSFVPEMSDGPGVKVTKKLKISFGHPKKYKALVSVLRKISTDVKELNEKTANVLVLFGSTNKSLIVSQLLTSEFKLPDLEVYLMLCRLQFILRSKRYLQNKALPKSRTEFYLIIKLLYAYVKQLLINDSVEEQIIGNANDFVDGEVEEELEAEVEAKMEMAIDEVPSDETANRNISDKLTIKDGQSLLNDKKEFIALEENANSWKSTKKINAEQGDFNELYELLNSIVEIQVEDKQVVLPAPSFAQNSHHFPVDTVNEFPEFDNLTIICQSFDRKSSFRNKYGYVDSYRPDFVIFYDVDIEYEREITRLDAIYPNCPAKPKQVYNIFIKNSIQSEQIYDRIVKENNYFDKIIDKFSNLPKYYASIKDLMREKKSGAILVDKREFNSRLPFRLYLLGVEIIPIMLEVADYILSNDVGVERKDCKTGDLAMSIKSGRLDRQIKSLMRKFKRPILLLENYQFCDSQSTVELYKIMHRNKGLAILWSADEGQTAKIFLHLKRTEPEPAVDRFSKTKDNKKLLAK